MLHNASMYKYLYNIVPDFDLIAGQTAAETNCTTYIYIYISKNRKYTNNIYTSN